MKRQISILLLCSILTSQFAGCGSSESVDTAAPDSPDSVTTVGGEETVPEEINRENAKLMLPELDFGEQQINIMYVGDEIVYRQDVFAEQTGDVVDDAIYARNLAIEELLNVKFNYLAPSNDTVKSAEILRKTVLANDDAYDLCSGHQSYTTKLITQGLYHNFVDDEYINWEMPWWNLDYMKEMAVGNDKIFFLMGDISLMCLKSLGAVYYNRDFYERLYGDPDEPYDLVFDGKWTFDKFCELVRGGYADLNGNTKVDDGDQFGSFANASKSVEHFQYPCGITTTTRDEEGIPRLTLNNERTINFVNDLYALYFENEGFYLDKNASIDDHIAEFMDGKYLFCPVWFRHADQIREMTTDYGIVNYPKYYEEDEYKTLVHNGTTVFVTPITSKIADKIGAVCEAMAYYNYVSVTPAYYEVALKVKYSRDDQTSQVLDLIAASATTNFGYVFSGPIAGIGDLRDMMQKKTKDFGSWFAKYESRANDSLTKLIDTYLEVE
ncbi:MAG: hypothetical protein E7632_08280 [Ruminococcaceae bacterium]|nr:hypothetical protein [Oscillospiraceae bacterium]